MRRRMYSPALQESREALARLTVGVILHPGSLSSGHWPGTVPGTRESDAQGRKWSPPHGDCSLDNSLISS